MRFTEGVSHGFLVLPNEAGDVVARGELVQAPRGARVENRLTFRFKDGSLWEETLTFTQQKVFRLMTYRHLQRGPSFPTTTDVSFDRDNGRYRAKVGEESTARRQRRPARGPSQRPQQHAHEEPAGGRQGDRTPPRLHPEAADARHRDPRRSEDRYFVGDAPRTATRFVLKIEVRGVPKLVASILGKDPPEVRYWIASGTAPAFVKFEGPLFLKGPRWRIELSAPRWPER